MGKVAAGIRPARLGDCAAIAAIYAQSVEARDCTMAGVASVQEFQQLVSVPDAREALLVLEAEGQVRGWGRVKHYSPRPGYRVCGETSIFLDRQHLGRGYGRPLQAALLEKCIELQYHHVVAKIWASNKSSIHFHEAFGFTLVGVQKEVGFVNGAWRDVAILQRIFPDVPPFQPDSF